MKWGEGFEPKWLIITSKTLAIFLERMTQPYDPGAPCEGITLLAPIGGILVLGLRCEALHTSRSRGSVLAIHGSPIEGILIEGITGGGKTG